jgi:hypothetical protein
MGKKILKFFLIFGRTMAIENLKKHLILSLLVFDFTFWLYIYIYRASKQKAGAILSGSQNTIYPFIFLATYYEP